MSGEYERQAFLSGPWLHRAMDQIMRNSQDEVRRSVGIGSPLDPNFQSSILATHTFFFIRHTTTIDNTSNPIKITGPQSSRTWRPNPSIITSCILILSSARLEVASAQIKNIRSQGRKFENAWALIHKKIRQRKPFFSVIGMIEWKHQSNKGKSWN